MYLKSLFAKWQPFCLGLNVFIYFSGPWEIEWNFRYVIFERILVIDDRGISCEIALIWVSLDFTDDQSTLVQVMAWCHQATSHYLSQCRPKSLSPYGITSPQWVNACDMGSRPLHKNFAILRHLLSLTRQVVCCTLSCHINTDFMATLSARQQTRPCRSLIPPIQFVYITIASMNLPNGHLCNVSQGWSRYG